jgi:hypothetical protein
MSITVSNDNAVTLNGAETLTNKTIDATENEIVNLDLTSLDPTKVDTELDTLPSDDTLVASSRAIILKLASKLSSSENLNDVSDKPTARENLDVLSSLEIADLISAISIIADRISDGTNEVTAVEARTHLNNVTKHRLINDSGTALDELWSASKISSQITETMGDLKSSILAPVQNLTEFKAIDTTDSEAYPDKILILVEDLGFYRLDRQSSTAGDDSTIVEPTAGVGRWIQVVSNTVPTHNQTSGIQGGTTNEYYHLTQEQSEGIPVDDDTKPTSSNKITTANQLIISLISNNEVVSQTLARDGANRPASTQTTFSNGYVLDETFNRDVNGVVTSIDKSVASLSINLTTTINRDGNGNYTGETTA